MSGHFEAKKIAWRQTKDGLVLALAVHPDEMPKEMALSPLNTRYMIGFAEIGDDEEPVGLGQAGEPQVSLTPPKEAANGLDSASTSSSEPASSSPKKPWSEYTRSQQAYLLCKDPEFWRYFGAANEINCDGKLKLHFRIASKSDLDKPGNFKNWDEFVAIWQMQRPR